MKRQFIYVLLSSALLFVNLRQAEAGETNFSATSDTSSYVTIQGQVRDVATRRPLAYVSVYIKGSNIASVSNFDGNFVLKAPTSITELTLLFSHLGYKNVEVSITNPQQTLTVNMEASSYTLRELVISALDYPSEIVKEALDRIPKNYGYTPVSMIGFYREFVRKNNNYVSIAEAVLDIRKAPYHNSQFDVARIYKGRKSGEIDRSDTIIFKYQGGIMTSLLLDAAKNPEILFSDKPFDNYNFTYNGMEMIDEKPHYIIGFNQHKSSRDILFRGKIYIEPNTFAIARVEFNMNVEDRPDASSIFVRRSPRGAQITPLYATYIINFREQNGRWFYSYGRAEVKFKSEWRRFIFFKPTCTIISELAITDVDEDNLTTVPRREAVRMNDIVAEKLSIFTGDAFWGSYNYIEPEQTIESAINRMNRRLRREGIMQDIEQEEME